MTRILIAEDEPGIVSFLEKGLRAEGYTTTHAATGLQALQMARDDLFDLAVLDLGLPGLDGQDVLRQLRRRGDQLPVVVLTARDGVEEMVRGFDGGADDYVIKPFRFEELLARIRARLRVDLRPDASNVLEGGRVLLDVRTRRARVDGRDIDLTAREFGLLETMLRHAGQVLSREQLLDRVWGYDFDPGSNVVDVYVRYLRKKLGDDVIQTVRGMGYRLVV